VCPGTHHAISRGYFYHPQMHFSPWCEITVTISCGFSSWARTWSAVLNRNKGISFHSVSERQRIWDCLLISRKGSSSDEYHDSDSENRFLKFPIFRGPKAIPNTILKCIITKDRRNLEVIVCLRIDQIFHGDWVQSNSSERRSMAYQLFIGFFVAIVH